MQGTKEAHRENWLDSDNRIFINKLNHICENHDKVTKDLKGLKTQVYKNHKVEIDDLFIKVKTLTDDFKITQNKVDTVQDKLPTTIREMVEYYINNGLDQRLEKLVTKIEFNNKVNLKMDYAYFNDYVKRDLDKGSAKDSEFELKEKLHEIEKQFNSFVNIDELTRLLKNKASKDTTYDLKLTMDRMNIIIENQANQSLSDQRSMEAMQENLT